MPVMSIYKNHVVTVTAHTKTNIFNYLAQAFIDCHCYRSIEAISTSTVT